MTAFYSGELRVPYDNSFVDQTSHKNAFNNGALYAPSDHNNKICLGDL